MIRRPGQYASFLTRHHQWSAGRVDVRSAKKGSAVSGRQTGAEEPSPGRATADKPAEGRADVGTGTLTGTAGRGAGPAGQASAGPAGPPGPGPSAPSAPSANGTGTRGNGNGAGARANGTASRTAQGRPGAGLAGPAGAGPAAPGTSGQEGLAARLGVPDWAVTWVVVMTPALAGLVMGGYKLGYPSLWRDEATTKVVVSRSVSQIFALLHHTDAVHGAYYMLVHFVVDVLGVSATTLRLPSLIAMAVACAFTAAVARRLTLMAGAPFAGFTGLCAGVTFAVLPFMTRYAQEARSYAIVTMLATIATYLLLRAVSDGRRWWAAYAVAIGLCGLFNIFGLLILVPHGVSLAIAGARQRAASARAARALTRPGTASANGQAATASRDGGSGGPGGSGLAVPAPAGLSGLSGRSMAGLPVRWLVAAVAPIIVLIPLGLVAYAQRGVLGWMSRPTFSAVVALAYNGAGSWRLITPIFTLAVGGVLAGLFIDRSHRPFTPGIVAFPWMVLPPALLIGVSEIHPFYDERYVEFCLPALAILVAWGIAWLARIAMLTPLGRIGLAWLPSAFVILGLLALLVTPDRQIRTNNARPDNLNAAAYLVKTHAKPGDIIFYIPISGRVLALAYPNAFKDLRDIALNQSPLASATIYGTDVSPAVLKRRFVNVTRVWTVSGTGDYEYSGQATPTDKEQVALLSGMHEIHHWWDGDTVLRLYAKGPAPASNS